MKKGPRWPKMLKTYPDCGKPFKTGVKAMKRGIKGGIKTPANGNGKYLKGDAALERARKIYVLRHFGGMTLGQIATVLHITGERVRQVLKTHKYPNMCIVDLSPAGFHKDSFTRIGP